MKEKQITPHRIGYQKLIKAIKQCDKEIQDKILEEYEKL